MSLISEDLGFSRAEMISLLQSNPSVPLAESTPEDEVFVITTQLGIRGSPTTFARTALASALLC